MVRFVECVMDVKVLIIEGEFGLIGRTPRI